jgi:subtilisin family serine protease
VRRGATALFALVATIGLAPSAGAAVGRGFLDLRAAGDRALVLPTISPPPRLAKAMTWYRWHPSSRTLLASAEDYGPAAVIGVSALRDVEPLRARYGFARVQVLKGLRAAEVSVTPAQLHDLLATAPADARIRYVQPVGPSRSLLRVRNDPLLRTVNPSINRPYEWQFAATRMDAALNISLGSPTILVGIVDSGVGDVPDLVGKVDARWYFTGQETGGNDFVGHGTAVASLVAANNDDGFGMAGFGGATHIVSFRDDALTDASIATAINKLVSLGVRVINLSVGGRAPDAPVLHDALNKAAIAGVLVVAAAGNDFSQSIAYPASDLQPPGGGQSYGLAVGATNVDNTRANFSNQGTHLSLVAPGNYGGPCFGVLAALSPIANSFDGGCNPIIAGDGGARYAYISGTSFSTPEVAGAAALLWAAAPDLKNFEVADILKRAAHHDASGGWSTVVGWGNLDVAAALEDATGRSSADRLAIAGFRFKRPAASSQATATAQVAWTDGIAPDPATILCSAAAGGVALAPTAQALDHGELTCAWDTTAVPPGRTIEGSIQVTDVATGLDATQPFSATLLDLTPPVARALAASGSWGATVPLEFGGNEETRTVTAQITVKRKARVVAHLQSSALALDPTKVYALRWRAPARKLTGPYSFCVTLFDAARNKSRPSCAAIRLS